MICGGVRNPSPIVSCSLSFGGRKNISGRLGKEVELQEVVECKLTTEKRIQKGT